MVRLNLTPPPPNYCASFCVVERPVGADFSHQYRRLHTQPVVSSQPFIRESSLPRMLRHIKNSVADIKSFGIHLESRVECDGAQHLDDLIAALRECPKLTHITLRTDLVTDTPVAAMQGLLSLPRTTSLDLDLWNWSCGRRIEFCDIKSDQLTPGLKRLHYRTDMEGFGDGLVRIRRGMFVPSLKECVIKVNDWTWFAYMDSRRWPSHYSATPRAKYGFLIPTLKASMRRGQLQNATVVRVLHETYHYSNGQKVLVAYDLLAGNHRILPLDAAWDAEGEPLPWPHDHPRDTEDDDLGISYQRMYDALCLQHGQPEPATRVFPAGRS